MREGEGKRKYFTVLVDGNWPETRRRYAWEHRSKYSAAHLPEDQQATFEPNWKATVAHNGVDRTGRPTNGKLVAFRHKDDLLTVRKAHDSICAHSICAVP